MSPSRAKWKQPFRQWSFMCPLLCYRSEPRTGQRYILKHPCPAESGARKCSQRSLFFLFLLRHRGAVTRWNHRSAKFSTPRFVSSHDTYNHCGYHLQPGSPHIVFFARCAVEHICAIDCRSWATPEIFGKARVRPPGPPRALVSLSSKDGSTFNWIVLRPWQVDNMMYRARVERLSLCDEAPPAHRQLAPPQVKTSTCRPLPWFLLIQTPRIVYIPVSFGTWEQKQHLFVPSLFLSSPKSMEGLNMKWCCGSWLCRMQKAEATGTACMRHNKELSLQEHRAC